MGRKKLGYGDIHKLEGRIAVITACDEYSITLRLLSGEVVRIEAVTDREDVPLDDVFIKYTLIEEDEI